MDERFVEIALLGRGGMGDVFLAVRTDPAQVGKLVVLKRLRSDVAEEPEFRTMFFEEAKLASRLQHPNIVETYEVGEDAKSFYIAMEYLDGQSLYAVIRRARKVANATTGEVPTSSRRLDPSAFALNLHLRIIADSLAGLHSAHELRDLSGNPLGLVHRDISPANVFVTYAGQAKLLDFGIAKAADASAHTRTGIIKGKIAYMAPERFKRRDVDRRADLFSVGAMLWEAAAGTRLWGGVADLDIFARIVADNIPSPREKNPTCDPSLEAIVKKALASDPERRYQTALELKLDLEATIEGLGGAELQAVGLRTSSLFERERLQVKELITTKLAELAAATNGEKVRIGESESSDIEVAPTEFVPNPARRRDLLASASAVTQRPPAAPAPSPPVDRVADRVAEPRGKTQGTLVMTKPTLPSMPHRLSPPRPVAPVVESQPAHTPAKAPPWKWIGVAAAGLVLAAGIGVATCGMKPSPPPPVVSKQTTLNVTSFPSGASVFIDERMIGQTPFRGNYGQDGLLHQIRIVYQGFDPHLQFISFDKPSADIDVQLHPSAPKK